MHITNRSHFCPLKLYYSRCNSTVLEMEAIISALVEEEKKRFPGGVPWKFSYGTAGFREKADKLDRVVFRVGVLAALRSKSVGAAIGIVITASHNPVEDNGVKVVDPLGDMLAPTWEKYATQLANASTDQVGTVLREIVQETGCDVTKCGRIVFARDTRPSGERLVGQLMKGVELLGSEFTDFGVLTTPQLHYIVRCINTNGSFGTPSEEGYYKKVAAAYISLLPTPCPSQPMIKLDGANGVGADKMRRMVEHLNGTAGEQLLNVQVLNDGTSGVLNKECGADYVKSQQAAPPGFEFTVGERCASFDGDGDRIVFFYKNSAGNFRMLDGDKIAALAAGFICERLKILQADLTIGVVQTAYANGSATAYLKDTLQVPVACTLTGVKHLHHKALDYDIGVYFESNGHGTVLFSDRAMEVFTKACEDQKLSSSAYDAAKQLLALTQLINQAVGDAISDFLLVEIILLHSQWGCTDWDAIYTELPNRQLKVKVKDRMVLKTTDFERKTTAPPGLQEEIDKLVAGTPKGRAFVRPSGTEDVVRVYAEAKSQVVADSLAVQVGECVYKLAGGVGEMPSLPSVKA